tara:strand:- start:2888 stop:3280 length:393 start_codon:yes stop_codon:yes gene_type:complete
MSLVVWIFFSFDLFSSYILPGMREIIDLGLETVSWSDLLLVWRPIMAYIVVSVGICLLVNSFKPLKSWGEEGLMRGLMSGLIVGVIWGVIWGVIGGVIWGHMGGLSGGFMGGLFGGLMWSLSGGLNTELK